MKKVNEIMKEKGFTFSVEVVPPRNGDDISAFIDSARNLRGIADFASVTKGAGGSLRSGSLPISFLIQERIGIPVVSHLVCRERTKYDIENDVIDVYYAGIRSILALRGDPPAGSKEEWKGEYKYAYLLARQISAMKQGLYLPKRTEQAARNGVKMDMCILAAGHPEDRIEDEINHIKAKVEAGAEAIITQMLFSVEDYSRYADALRKAGINVPIIVGIRPLVSLKQAQGVESFFGIKVPDEIKNGLEKGGKEFGLEYFSDLAKKLKKARAAGVHLFVLNDFELAKELHSSVFR